MSNRLFSPLWKANKTGEKAWDNGQVNFSPAWIGFKNGNQISRFGFSHREVQDLFQNGAHRLIPTPYYLSYDYFQGGYIPIPDITVHIRYIKLCIIMRIVVVFCVLFVGCLGANTTRKLTSKVKIAFTNKLEGNVTSLPERIDINGFYRYWNRIDWGGYKQIPNSKDTAFVDMIFYPDGTYVFNTSIGRGFSSYSDYFESISKSGSSDIFYKSHLWGIYTIVGDTIKAQSLMHAANFTPWWGRQDWFLIMENKQLKLIYTDGLFDDTESDIEISRNYVKTASSVLFHPLDFIPPPYAWFKKDRFFWRNKDDWEHYMNVIKENESKK